MAVPPSFQEPNSQSQDFYYGGEGFEDPELVDEDKTDEIQEQLLIEDGGHISSRLEQRNHYEKKFASVIKKQQDVLRQKVQIESTNKVIPASD